MLAQASELETTKHINPNEFDAISNLQGVPKSEKQWLAAHSELRILNQGELYSKQGQEVSTLQFVLEGTLQVIRHEDGKEIGEFRFGKGDITGLIPFSRMKHFGGTVRALVPTRIAELDKSLFPKLHQHAPEILQKLVNTMLDRTREFTRLGAQREKLISLGTMSAGLAHELNNPAAAAKRAANSLSEVLQAFDEHSSSLLKPTFFKELPDNSDFNPIQEALNLNPELDALTRGDLEDDLSDWLTEQEIPDPWEVAATLISGGYTRNLLENFSQQIVPRKTKDFLIWLYRDIEMRLLAFELVESTTRISDLVKAMKEYTYMDRGLEQEEVDIHEGIKNTLIILKHKLKKKMITVEKNFVELPKIRAYGSELNQVWTNLIANAIEALPEGGKIRIRAWHDQNSKAVCIEIADNGSGIPKDIQDRIFEPFFTTKGVNEGTGMGLDIVNRIISRRHYGTIRFTSEPGNTRFIIRLPI